MTEPTREQVEREIADWLCGLHWTHRDAEPAKRMATAIKRGEYRKDKA